MDFAVKGILGSGDSLAALALVRALLRQLQQTGMLSETAANTVIENALAQLPQGNVDRYEEARRLLGALRSR